MAEVGDERPRANTLMVVKLGFTYKYTIPNFSVITVELRHAKVKKPGNDYFFDTFFKDNITLELIPPVCVQVTESCFTKVSQGRCVHAHAWCDLFGDLIMQAKEFVAQLQLPGIQLEDDNIQIVWNCTVIGDNECDDDDAIEDKEETTSNSDTNSLSSNQREENIQEDSTVPHTIVFKCIGAVRDVGSQRALRTARDNIHNGWTVPVRMIPEPTNIVDSRAIVFECKLKGK